MLHHPCHDGMSNLMVLQVPKLHGSGSEWPKNSSLSWKASASSSPLRAPGWRGNIFWHCWNDISSHLHNWCHPNTKNYIIKFDSHISQFFMNSFHSLRPFRFSAAMHGGTHSWLSWVTSIVSLKVLRIFWSLWFTCCNLFSDLKDTFMLLRCLFWDC